MAKVSSYVRYARDSVHEMSKSNDKLIVYKFMKKVIEIAKESPYDFIIPIVELPEEYKDYNKAKYKKAYDKANIGFRFTENCIISNKCNKKCYRYKICKEEYKKSLNNLRNKNEEDDE